MDPLHIRRPAGRGRTGVWRRGLVSIAESLLPCVDTVICFNLRVVWRFRASAVGDKDEMHNPDSSQLNMLQL